MSAWIIDTSSDRPFLLICTEDAILQETHFTPDKSLSSQLLTALQELLTDAAPLYIGIGIGPGSYTATRIGASIAATLCFARKIPLIAFFSPLAFLPFESGTFLLLKDAKQGRAYAIAGEKKEGLLLYAENLGLLPLTSLPSATHHLSDIVPSTLTLHLPTLPPYLYSRFLRGDTTLATELRLLYLHNF